MLKEERYQGPAAAVIPAPIAYIKVVAVKKLVVGFLALCATGLEASASVLSACASHLCWKTMSALHWVGVALQLFYFEKIRVLKAGLQPE